MLSIKQQNIKNQTLRPFALEQLLRRRVRRGYETSRPLNKRVRQHRLRHLTVLAITRRFARLQGHCYPKAPPYGLAIGRLRGSGTFTPTGLPATGADALIFAALLKIASAARWNASTAFSSSLPGRVIPADSPLS